MRILYLSQYFPPEVGATQTRAYEMARGLIERGHQVTMITEFPNHPSGIIPPAYRGKVYERSNLDGIEVIRLWVKASPVKRFGSRMAFYLSYMFMAIGAGLLLARGKFDLIYATSPPLFVGVAGVMLSRLRRIPLVFEVRDLWPESAVVLGELQHRYAIRMAEACERMCYRQAKQLVVVTEGIRQRLLARGIPAEKLRLITNGANTETFHPQPEAAKILRRELGLDGAFVVLYAGIHGLAQGLELLLEAAQRLHVQQDIRFLFVGEGPVKSQLQQKAEELSLSNVIFHSEVSRERMPEFLSLAQVAVVPLRKSDLFLGALPSKMFDAWACACPTLVGIAGEARDVLRAANAGVWVEPENTEDLILAIQTLRQDTSLCRVMGENGRRYVARHYSRHAQARQLSELLEALIPG